MEPSAAQRGLAVALLALASCDTGPEPAPPLPVLAEEEPPADSVYRNGRIYTVDRHEPWAEAVAINDGWLVAVGGEADVAPLIGPDTEVVDLGGLMAMPGIFDLHAHPFTAALFSVDHLDFSDPFSPETMLAELSAYAEAHPEKTWIRGGSWGAGVFPGDAPTRDLLDAVVPDRPVVLIDRAGHSYWLNTPALELAGIDAATPAEGGVVVERDPATGEPSGTVRGMVLRRVERAAAQPTSAEYAAALDTVFRKFASFGVTAMQTAEGTFPALDAVQELERSGRLPLRLFVAWDWHTHWITPFTDRELDHQIRDRVRYESALVYPNTVAIFADTAPAGRGARLLEPYSDGSGEYGSMRLAPQALRDAVVDFDRRGIGTFVQAVGDGAVRAALDAVEAARAHNGDTGVRHEIAHANWIAAEDVERFGRISGVAVVVSAATHPTADLANAVVPLLGEERYRVMWPVRSLLDAGAYMVYGSDWRALAPPSPWPPLQSFVTRRNPDAPELGTLGRDQRVSLERALQMLTLAGAHAVGEDDELGSLEVGKQADMIVLDRNLFEIEPEAIRGTRVLKTILAGRVVYDRGR